MATEFVAFQPPPGDTLSSYDRTQPHDAQPSTVPKTFREAMEVREDVFVKEQNVPLENELDEDDPRSFHWVVYASVGNTAAPSPSALRPVDATNTDEERRGSESTATRVPVGTIRLVPPPHKAHAEHTGHDGVDADNSPKEYNEDWRNEPYIKLGRLAVLKPYRRLGLSKLLINSATTWATDHEYDIQPPKSPAEIEAAKQEGKAEELPWKGLVLVHAQTQVRRLWENAGFALDPKMGTWMEEGIEHIGLWKRLAVKDENWKGNLASPGILEVDRKVSI